MVFTANIQPRNIVPNRRILVDATLIGTATLIVSFLFQTFGISSFINALPEAWKTFAFVAAGVYLRNLIDLKTGQKNIL